MRGSRLGVMLLIIVSMIFLIFGSVYADTDEKYEELVLDTSGEYTGDEIPDFNSRLQVFRYNEFDTGITSGHHLYGAINKIKSWVVGVKARSTRKYRQTQLWFVLLKPKDGVDIEKQSYWENKGLYQVVHGIGGSTANPYKFRFGTMALANWVPSSSTVESANAVIISRKQITDAIEKELGQGYDTTGIVLGIGANFDFFEERPNGDISILKTVDTLADVQKWAPHYGFSGQSISHMEQRFQMAPLDGSFDLKLNLYEYGTSPLKRIPDGECEVTVKPVASNYTKQGDEAKDKYIYKYINNPVLELEAKSNENWGFEKWEYKQGNTPVEKTDSKIGLAVYNENNKLREVVVNAFYKRLGGADFYPTPENATVWKSSYASDSGVKVKGVAGETVSFTVRVYNAEARPDGKTDLKVFWWGSEDSSLDYKLTNNLKGGEYQSFTFSNIVVPSKDAENRLVFKVNSDNNTPVDEVNKTNNTLIIRVEENVAITGNYDVPEWRLSKYWNEIVPAVDVVEAKSWYSLPPGGCCGGVLRPSGTSDYELRSVEGLPIWVRTLQKLAPYESLERSITKGNPKADIKVYGDLLAIKTNNEIDNIKTSSWVSGNDNLGDLNIGSANKGVLAARGAGLEKECVFDYNIKNNQLYSYTYSVGWCGSDEDGSWSCSRVTITPSENNSPASYKVKFNFLRHIPTDTTPVNIPVKEEVKNGDANVTAQSGSILKINPEVFMIYSQQTNNSHQGVFTAGDKLREMKPVSYHTIRFSADVKPSVVGLAPVTDVKAKALVNNIAAGKPVTLKGASANISFVPNGKIVISSYLLDVKDATLKTAWGNAGYDTTKLSDDFMKKFATKNADGTWNLPGKAIQQLKIKNNLYGKNTSNIVFKNISNTVKEHNIVVRGGKVVSGVPVGCPSDIFEKMGLLPGETDSVLSVFQRGKGAVPDELAFKTLAKAARNGQDIAGGWYNEDTTALVIREYVSVFELPLVFYSDKIPMSVPGLETPVNKNMFFSKGEAGHTTLRFSIAAKGSSLNPFDSSAGSKEVYMQYDSSEISNPFGAFSKDFIVPNVSILDTMF